MILSEKKEGLEDLQEVSLNFGVCLNNDEDAQSLKEDISVLFGSICKYHGNTFLAESNQILLKNDKHIKISVVIKGGELHLAILLTSEDFVDERDRNFLKDLLQNCNSVLGLQPYLFGTNVSEGAFSGDVIVGLEGGNEVADFLKDLLKDDEYLDISEDEVYFEVIRAILVHKNDRRAMLADLRGKEKSQVLLDNLHVLKKLLDSTQEDMGSVGLEMVQEIILKKKGAKKSFLLRRKFEIEGQLQQLLKGENYSIEGLLCEGNLEEDSLTGLDSHTLLHIQAFIPNLRFINKSLKELEVWQEELEKRFEQGFSELHVIESFKDIFGIGENTQDSINTIKSKIDVILGFVKNISLFKKKKNLEEQREYFESFLRKITYLMSLMEKDDNKNDYKKYFKEILVSLSKDNVFFEQSGLFGIKNNDQEHIVLVIDQNGRKKYFCFEDSDYILPFDGGSKVFHQASKFAKMIESENDDSVNIKSALSILRESHEDREYLGYSNNYLKGLRKNTAKFLSGVSGGNYSFEFLEGHENIDMTKSDFPNEKSDLWLLVSKRSNGPEKIFPLSKTHIILKYVESLVGL